MAVSEDCRRMFNLVYIQGAPYAGADGYLLKEDADIELFPAIEKIRRGGIYLSVHLNEMEYFWVISFDHCKIIISEDCFKSFPGLEWRKSWE